MKNKCIITIIIKISIFNKQTETNNYKRKGTDDLNTNDAKRVKIEEPETNAFSYGLSQTQEPTQQFLPSFVGGIDLSKIDFSVFTNMSDEEIDGAIQTCNKMFSNNAYLTEIFKHISAELKAVDFSVGENPMGQILEISKSIADKMMAVTIESNISLGDTLNQIYKV